MRSIGLMCALAALAVGTVLGQAADWTSLMAQGDVRESAGDYTAAAADYRQALRLAEQPEEPTRLSRSLNALAAASDQLGELAEAGRLYRRAIAVVEKSRGRECPEYASALGNMAAHYLDLGQPEHAEPMLREALAIYTEKGEPEDPRVPIAQSDLAVAVMQRGRYDEATGLLLKAISGLEKLTGAANRLQAAAAIGNLGMMRHFQRRDREATELFERSVEIVKAEAGGSHPWMIRPLVNVAVGYWATGRRDESGAALRSALAIAEERLGSEHPLYGSVLLNYAMYLRLTGHKAESRAAEARSKMILGDNARRNGMGMTLDASALARH